MSGSTAKSFTIVRHGYDADEVEAFLLNQASAWKNAVNQAIHKALGLKGELGKSQQRERALLDELASVLNTGDTQLADIDREVDSKRSEAERVVKQLVEDAEVSIAEKLSETEAKAASIIQQAEEEASSGLADLEKMRTTQNDVLESEHIRSVSKYAEVEAKLIENIKELNDARLALLDGLESIAKGGLANAETFEGLLASIGIDSNDSTSASA